MAERDRPPGKKDTKKPTPHPIRPTKNDSPEEPNTAPPETEPDEITRQPDIDELHNAEGEGDSF